MRPADVPVVSLVFGSGPDDRVYDSLLLLGPVVVFLLALVGRTLPTLALAAGYICVLISYVFYRGVASSASS